jgi:hypothetical protein
MYNPDTDFIFPPRILPALQGLRGQPWQNLVSRVSELETIDPGRLGFELFMVRLSGCATCQADSYRGMQGCTQCVLQIVRRFRGSDHELLDLYSEAQREVGRYLKHS